MHIHTSRKTLQLTQLLLAVLGLYLATRLHDMAQFVIPLLVIGLVVLLDRLETGIVDERKEREDGAELQRSRQSGRLDTLLHGKNHHALVATVERLLKEMGVTVTDAPDSLVIDKLLVPDRLECTFGLWVLTDIEILHRNWSALGGLKQFDTGRGSRQRALILINNSTTDNNSGKVTYKKISQRDTDILRSQGIIAMTTTTFYKIYRLCIDKGRSPNLFFTFLQQHHGGVFRLEDYRRKKKKAPSTGPTPLTQASTG